MKTYNKPATSKLIAHFDDQLKNLLTEDLKAFKQKNRFYYNNQAIIKAA